MKDNLPVPFLILHKMAGVWQAPPAGLIRTALSDPNKDKSGR